jgi:hypothetical protein
VSEEPRHPAQSTASTKEGWPKNVRPISLDGMDRLGVSNDGKLFWDGRPIAIKKYFSLTFWQKLGAFLTVVGTFLSGVCELLKMFGIGHL